MCVSAWRDGSQQANHDGQQQKTTQEQSELAHWNLYSVMTRRRGWPKSANLPSTPVRKAGPGGYCQRLTDTVTEAGSRKKSGSDEPLIRCWSELCYGP
ncbi:conserved hypothetical protein [Pseudomonas entomophila L48]|uniref:Uncharacterized protein n=1 Tax=Pseudomonas entomophila (strain L48) TaxID=384676 RepID=Q1IB95_PSEE4|nr:conserved hypothetical protein [Pseudomonas entomophila L48]